MRFYSEHNDGKHISQIYDVRPILKENFTPMIYSMLDKGHLSNCVQVKIKFLGSYFWINVYPSELKDISISHNIWARRVNKTIRKIHDKCQCGVEECTCFPNWFNIRIREACTINSINRTQLKRNSFTRCNICGETIKVVKENGIMTILNVRRSGMVITGDYHTC
jgi:hypothetical protein